MDVKEDSSKTKDWEPRHFLQNVSKEWQKLTDQEKKVYTDKAQLEKQAFI